MHFSDMVDAVNEAKSIVMYGDNAIRRLAKLMINRLRVSGVDHFVLCKLKIELRDFNMRTGQWKE